MRNAIVLLTLALIMAACGAPAAPTPTSASAGIPVPSVAPSDTPQPSPSPSPTMTVTLAPLDTPTIQPSNTAIALPSFTPFVFKLPSASPTRPGSGELSCQVMSQSVVDGTSFNPNERFSVNWKVQNTGSATWFPASVQFIYVAGTKMHQYSPVSLELTVPPGQMAGLSADMRAPKNSSSYTTSWGLRRGTEVFCIVRVTIWVEAPPTQTPTP